MSMESTGTHRRLEETSLLAGTVDFEPGGYEADQDRRAWTATEQSDVLGPQQPELGEQMQEPFSCIQDIYIVLNKTDLIAPDDKRYGFVRKIQPEQLAKARSRILERAMQAPAFAHFVEQEPLPLQTGTHDAENQWLLRSIQENERLEKRGEEYAAYDLSIRQKLARPEFARYMGRGAQPSPLEDIKDRADRLEIEYEEFDILMKQKIALEANAGGREVLDDCIVRHTNLPELPTRLPEASFRDEVQLLKTYYSTLEAERAQRMRQQTESRAQLAYDHKKLGTESTCAAEREQAEQKRDRAVAEANRELKRTNEAIDRSYSTGISEATELKQETLERCAQEIAEQADSLVTDSLKAWFKTTAGKSYYRSHMSGTGIAGDHVDRLTTVRQALVEEDFIIFQKEHSEAEDEHAGAQTSPVMAQAEQPVPPTTARPEATPPLAAGRKLSRQTNTANLSGRQPRRSRQSNVSEPSANQATPERKDTAKLLSEQAKGLGYRRVVLNLAKELSAIFRQEQTPFTKDNFFKELEAEDSPFHGLIRGPERDEDFVKVVGEYFRKGGNVHMLEVVNERHVYFMQNLINDVELNEWVAKYGIDKQKYIIGG